MRYCATIVFSFTCPRHMSQSGSVGAPSSRKNVLEYPLLVSKTTTYLYFCAKRNPISSIIIHLFQVLGRFLQRSERTWSHSIVSVIQIVGDSTACSCSHRTHAIISSREVNFLRVMNCTQKSNFGCTLHQP